MGEEAVAEGALGKTTGAFGDVAIGGGSTEVEAGDEVDGCGGADVRGPGDAKGVGELSDAEGFGYATCSANVGEEEVAFVVEESVADHIAIAIGFTNGNADGCCVGELAIACVVFGEECVFEPFDVAECFEELGKTKGVFEVKTTMSVNEKFATVAYSVRHLANEVHLLCETTATARGFDDGKPFV